MTVLPPIARVTRNLLERVAGTYGDDRGRTVKLSVRDRYLYVEPNDLAVPEDVIFLPQSPREFTAFNPQAREVTHLDFTEPSAKETAARLVLPSGETITLRKQKI